MVSLTRRDRNINEETRICTSIEDSADSIAFDRIKKGFCADDAFVGVDDSYGLESGKSVYFDFPNTADRPVNISSELVLKKVDIVIVNWHRTELD